MIQLWPYFSPQHENGHPLSEEEVARVFSVADEDGDGFLSINGEFSWYFFNKIMLSSPGPNGQKGHWGQEVLQAIPSLQKSTGSAVHNHNLCTLWWCNEKGDVIQLGRHRWKLVSCVSTGICSNRWYRLSGEPHNQTLQLTSCWNPVTCQSPVWTRARTWNPHWNTRQNPNQKLDPVQELMMEPSSGN